MQILCQFAYFYMKDLKEKEAENDESGPYKLLN